MHARLFYKDNELLLESDFNRDFVADLKTNRAIPPYMKRWDPELKLWRFCPAVSAELERVLSRYYLVVGPDWQQYVYEPVKTKGRITYLGRETKERGNGYWTVHGTTDIGQVQSWPWVFPEPVLQRWLDGEDAPDATAQAGAQVRSNLQGDYFQQLGLSPSCSGDEVKSAYRALVRQWHPDVYKGPDGAEVFRKLTEAYQILSDDSKRVAYAAAKAVIGAVAVYATANQPTGDKVVLPTPGGKGISTGIRCGEVEAICLLFGATRIVTKILSWVNITNSQGDTLNPVYDFPNHRIVEKWVSANEFVF